MNRLCTFFAVLVAGTMLFAQVPLHAAEDGGDHGSHSDGSHGEHHAHDPGHGNAGASLEDASEFRTDLAIYTFVVFMCLLALLSSLAWPKISAALEEREKRIEKNIADAEAMNEEAKQMLAQHEAKLANAADEVRELMEEARRDAETTKAQIIADAKQAADQERDRAIRDVEVATDAALRGLAEKSANLAVDLAGKVIRQNITSDQQAELVKEALGSLASANPSNN